MQIEGTPKIREISRHYSFYRFFFFLSIHCRVILGAGDQATNNVMLRKVHYLVKAFTQEFQSLSFAFVCSVYLSVCACMSISLFLGRLHPNISQLFTSLSHHQITEGFSHLLLDYCSGL